MIRRSSCSSRGGDTRINWCGLRRTCGLPFALLHLHMVINNIINNKFHVGNKNNSSRALIREAARKYGGPFTYPSLRRIEAIKVSTQVLKGASFGSFTLRAILLCEVGLLGSRYSIAAHLKLDEQCNYVVDIYADALRWSNSRGKM